MTVRGWWSALWPTRRSRALDLSIAFGIAAFDGVVMYFAPHAFWFPKWEVSAASVVLALALVVRRRHPVGLAMFGLIVSPPTGGGALSALVVLYSLGAYAASRRMVITIGLAGYVAFLVFPGPTAADDPFIIQALFGFAFSAPPLLLGLYMGARKQLVRSLQERAERLEREQHLLAERARGEERTRIAREMHDVVANRVSVMVVHAGALKAIAVKDPTRAAETAAVIGDMGRQALEELRQVIGVLRRGEEALPHNSSTLAEIRELIGQSSAAGLSVELTVLGEERPMPATVGRTLYRLVQEALTNVHKHAGDADTAIELCLALEAVEVEVRNDPPRAAPRHGLPSGGNGLVGLRERVTGLGGGFEAGPRAGGGFKVCARLPLPIS